MISYFSDSSAISEILQLATSLLGTALSIAAIIYTLYLAFATSGVTNGKTMIKNFELRRLIQWTVIASVFEMLSVLITMLWSIILRMNIVVVASLPFILGTASIAFLIIGLFLVFAGLMGILKHLGREQ